MSISVVMPQLGESIVEATLVRWLVGIGDAVAQGQTIAEVETDKASSEIPAPAAGTLARRLVEEGETVDVGTPIAEIETNPLTEPTIDMRSQLRAAGKSMSELVESTASDPAAHHIPPLRDEAPDRIPPLRSAEDARRAALASEPSRAPSERLPTNRLAPIPVDREGAPRRSSPAVRRLAREHGIALDDLAGSGRHGRVTRDDVLAMVDDRVGEPPPRAAGPTHPTVALRPPRAAPLPHPIASSPPPISRSEVTPFETALPAPIERRSTYRPARYVPKATDTVVPFSRRRRWIAEHMVHSLGESAHVAAVTEIDMSRVMRAKDVEQPRAEARGVKMTFMPFVVSAVADALAAHPELNATVLDDRLVLRGDRNIGVAVDTAEGLVVPVIKRADELGLLGVARAIQELSQRAREGTLSPDDVADGSFTLSNPGRDGNLFGVSIIRQPEVGILRLGAVVKRPVVKEIDGEDAIVIRPMMYACLSYDHRVIDGRTGNAFLSRVASSLAGWSTD